jgi:hypothetical protein
MYERIDRWKLSEPIWLATTKAEPEQLEAMGPIRFETDADDLGEFKVGFIQLGSGLQLMLQRYANPYLGGTMLLVPEGTAMGAALVEVLAALLLTRDDLADVSPETGAAEGRSGA